MDDITIETLFEWLFDKEEIWFIIKKLSISEWGTTEEGSVYRFRVPLEEYYREVEQLYEEKNK